MRELDISGGRDESALWLSYSCATWDYVLAQECSLLWKIALFISLLKMRKQTTDNFTVHFSQRRTDQHKKTKCPLLPVVPQATRLGCSCCFSPPLSSSLAMHRHTGRVRNWPGWLLRPPLRDCGWCVFLWTWLGTLRQTAFPLDSSDFVSNFHLIGFIFHRKKPQ